MSETLSQVQIIQSLSEALSWFEKELEWGTPKGELRHLTGRIGELYAAMITRGQMALNTNQRGYDVVSADNERISVKTITTSNHIRLNMQTMHLVQRIIILRINVDEDSGTSIEELHDFTPQEAQSRGTEANGALSISVRQNKRAPRQIEGLLVIDSAMFEDFEIKRYESGTIEIRKANIIQSPTRPWLRDIARKIGVEIVFDSGRAKNTRHLGAHIIKALNASND